MMNGDGSGKLDDSTNCLSGVPLKGQINIMYSYNLVYRSEITISY
jgi:hypothetical protein